MVMTCPCYDKVDKHTTRLCLENLIYMWLHHSNDINSLYIYLQLVELKNGETYNGHLVNCDNWMNIQLREVICTSRVSCGARETGVSQTKKDFVAILENIAVIEAHRRSRLYTEQ